PVPQLAIGRILIMDVVSPIGGCAMSLQHAPTVPLQERVDRAPCPRMLEHRTASARPHATDTSVGAAFSPYRTAYASLRVKNGCASTLQPCSGCGTVRSVAGRLACGRKRSVWR